MNPFESDKIQHSLVPRFRFCLRTIVMLLVGLMMSANRPTAVGQTMPESDNGDVQPAVSDSNSVSSPDQSERAKERQLKALLDTIAHGDSEVRMSAMKVCAECAFSNPVAQAIKSCLRDADRLVQRSAADAAANHTSIVLFKELVNSLVVCPRQDIDLQQALKDALQNQLQHDEIVDWFLQGVQPQIAYSACCQVVEELKTDRVAELVLAALENNALPDAKTAAIIEHAAAYAKTSDANRLVAFADSFPAFELVQRANAYRILMGGFARNSVADLTAFQAFEAKLLNQLIPTVDVKKLNWGRYQWDDRPAGNWQLEDRVNSNSMASRFLGSHSTKQSSVSILRSKTFVVPFQQSLELAGHSGASSGSRNQDSRLILRESSSGKVLRKQQPPESDQAVSVSWKMVDVVGKRAVLELYDGVDDSRSGWIAIGAIAPAVVNRSKGQQAERQDQLETVVRILAARSQQGILQNSHLELLAEVVEADQVNGRTRQMAAEALFGQRGLHSLAAVSVLLKYGRVAMPIHNQIAAACAVDEPWVARIVKRVDQPASPSPSSRILVDPLPKQPEQPDLESLQMVKADPLADRSTWVLATIQSICDELPEFYLIRLAREMAATQRSAELLVDAIKMGTPSASVLRDPTVMDMLKSHGPQLAVEVEQLLEEIPSEHHAMPIKQLLAE